MAWIREHKRVWRAAALVLLLAAVIGPWAFDRVYVPEEYTCTPPFVRLEGDFCGLPLSGVKVFPMMAGVLINVGAEVVSGAIAPVERVGEFVLSLGGLLLLFPFVSTVLLLRQGGSQILQRLHMAGVGLAAGVLLAVGIQNFSQRMWGLWGVWLYAEVLAAALVLEVLAFVGKAHPER